MRQNELQQRERQLDIQPQLSTGVACQHKTEALYFRTKTNDTADKLVTLDQVQTRCGGLRQRCC